ncbi:MAG: S8 family serine peptidase [candidate division Zixibacteria bacterium]|nr:S8 family serine peptidase [candidate division Zixibacteria bacterium]
MLMRILVTLIAVGTLTAAGGSLSLAQEFYYDLNIQYNLVPSSQKIGVQLDTTQTMQTQSEFFTVHPCLDASVTPEYLQRGFWIYGLQPGYGFEGATSDLHTDASVNRVVPVYMTQSDLAEFKVTDLVDVQFDIGLSHDSALGLLASHGLRFVDSSTYRHSLWTCTLDDSIKASPLTYGNAMHVLPGVKWACARQYASPVLAGTATPTDPYYQYQYYLNNAGQNSGIPGIDIAAAQAWQVPLADSSLIVAVIDDGIALHSDLPASRILPGYDFAGNCISCIPSSPPDSDPTPGPNQNHGMACAGILAASHNGIGVAGVFGGCRILPVKIYDNSGIRADATPIADAIRWARDEGARVLSCGWTYPGTAPIVAVANAIRDVVDPCSGCMVAGPPTGAVVVFAAGNDLNYNGGPVLFPANMPEVIAVGAVDNTGQQWSYSRTGFELDVVAPSGDINLWGDQWTIDQSAGLGWNPLVTGSRGDAPDQGYTMRMGGTSGACPQVAGIAALLLARGNPEIDPVRPYLKIREIITRSATDDIGPAGVDPYYGYGRANAYRAMLSIIHGDVNNDGMRDVMDVIGTIDVAFSGANAALDNSVADVNCDSAADVFDVITLIGHILQGEPAPAICYEW